MSIRHLKHKNTTKQHIFYNRQPIPYCFKVLIIQGYKNSKSFRIFMLSTLFVLCFGGQTVDQQLLSASKSSSNILIDSVCKCKLNKAKKKKTFLSKNGHNSHFCLDSCPDSHQTSSLLSCRFFQAKMF